jgi:LysR family transcriptional regulator of abg operon
VLLAVVESGSLRAAARSMKISPPAVTKALRQLEDELRVRLVERTQRGVIPTAAGRAFIARARVIRSELRKAEEELAPFAGNAAGSVSIGVGPTEMNLLVPDVVAQFRQRFPLVRIRFMEGLHSAWLPMVREGTLDFGVGRRPTFKLDAWLAFRPLFRSQFVVAARKGHPLRHARSLAQLAQAEWLTLASRESSTGLLDQMFYSLRLAAPRQPLIECESFNGVVAMVAKTNLVTLLARRLLSMPVARDVLQEIPIADRLPSVTHGILMRSDTPLTATAAELLKAISVVAKRFARPD